MAHKQKLQRQLIYSSIEDILAKKDPLTKYMKVNPERLLRTYEQNGFINNQNDMIVIPEGTVLTYVKTIEPDLYDIYHVEGKRTCYIAVAPRTIVDLFGPVAYKESDNPFETF